MTSQRSMGDYAAADLSAAVGKELLVPGTFWEGGSSTERAKMWKAVVTKEDKTKEDKTKEDKTKEDKTKEDKTKGDKTKMWEIFKKMKNTTGDHEHPGEDTSEDDEASDNAPDSD
jgi:hypothetical protein